MFVLKLLAAFKDLNAAIKAGNFAEIVAAIKVILNLLASDSSPMVGAAGDVEAAKAELRAVSDEALSGLASVAVPVEGDDVGKLGDGTLIKLFIKLAPIILAFFA